MRAESPAVRARGRSAGSRLGSDDNHRWTAFGPVNAVLHCVDVADRLGVAGAAIDHARQVDLDKPPVTERRAAELARDQLESLAAAGW